MPRRSFWTWVLAAVVLGLAVRTAHLTWVLRSTLPRWHLVEHSSDSAATWKVAQQLREEGLLCPRPYRPPLGVGTEAQWEAWFGSPGVFNQAPLYAYLLALTLARDGEASLLLVLQSLLDVATIALVALLGRSWGSERAGLGAAFVYALALTPVALGALVLRDSVGMFLLASGVALFEWARARGPLRWPWGLSGLVLGLGVLQRENLLAALVALAVLTLVREGRRPGLAFGAGGLAALLPLFVRNALVGAPLLAMASAGPTTLVAGLAVEPDSDAIGHHLPRRLTEYLELAHGSMLRMLGVIWDQAEGHRADFLALFARKVWALTSGYEAADNIDLDNLVWKSDALKVCLETGLLIGPLLVGVWAAWRLRSSAAAGLVVCWTLGAVLLLPPVFWRVRAGLLPIAIPLAACGLERLLRERTRRLAVAGAVAVALSVVAQALPPKPLHEVRWVEVVLAARVHVEAGDTAAAIAELDAYLEQAKQGRVQGHRVKDVVELRSALVAGVAPDLSGL